MSRPIQALDPTAPTPQNTPLTQAPLAAGLSRPTVPAISEENEPEEGDDTKADEEDEDDDEIEAINAPGVREAMLGMVQGRLAGLLGRSSGYIESLPIETRRKVEGLKGVQVKQDELQRQYRLECLELEKKYLNLAKPLYARRNAIVSGNAVPTEDEIKAGEEVSTKDDPEYTPIPTPEPGASESSSAIKGIPEFWLTALRNHIGLNDLITDRDAEALKSLTDICVEYLDSADAGFKLIFTFAPNEYFEQTVLEKTYQYGAESSYAGELLLDKAIGTEIKWKADKDLTKEYEIKKQRNKNTNHTRLVRKARPTESFFNFFSPPTPIDEDLDVDEEEEEDNDARIELDYQIGEDFKDKIIPKAVDYYTGKALEMDMLEAGEDDDDYEDEEDEDDDFDEDDDEDDDEPPAPRRRINAAAVRAAGKNVNAEDCKSQ